MATLAFPVHLWLCPPNRIPLFRAHPALFSIGSMLAPRHGLAIYHPDRIKETHPDYVLILPWNLKEEVMEQLAYIREWEGKFIVPIPAVKIYS